MAATAAVITMTAPSRRKPKRGFTLYAIGLVRLTSVAPADIIIAWIAAWCLGIETRQVDERCRMDGSNEDGMRLRRI